MSDRRALMAANQDEIFTVKRIKISNGTPTLVQDEVYDFSNVTTIANNSLYQVYSGRGELYGSVDFSSLQIINNDNGLKQAFCGCSGITGPINFQNLYLCSGAGPVESGFYNCTNLTGTPDFRNIVSLTGNEFYYAFYNCTSLTGTPNFTKLESLTGGRCLEAAFNGCTGLTGSPIFSNLQIVNGYSPLATTFRDCYLLSGTVSFPKLHTLLGSYTTNQMFYGCINLSSATFPKLTTFTAASIKSIFYQCTGITEVHFRADLDSTHQGYLTKANLFGGTTSTFCHPDLQILFDLTDDD